MPPADCDGDIVVREQRLPATPCVAGIGCHDIGAVDLTRAVVAFEPHHLVWSVGAIEHRDGTGKALPAQVLLAQIAKPDPRLAYKAAAREMDPRRHHFHPPRVGNPSVTVAGVARVIVIAPRKFDEHAGLVPDRPGIVTRRQQHHVVS